MRARPTTVPGRALLSPAGVRGAAREAAWVSAHLATYPLGLVAGRRRPRGLGYAVGSLPPLRRGLVVSDITAAGTPVLLLHGMVDNASVFTILRRGLERQGFGAVVPVNYSPLTMDVREAARRLSVTVEDLCERSGSDHVRIVGHSLGGLVARYYVQRLGGDAHVPTLITLGTPHTGTATAYALPLELGRQLRPGSDLMSELAEPAPGCRTRVVAYWSDLDQMMIPKRAAQLDHPDIEARNVLVNGVGHLSFAIDRRVVRSVGLDLARSIEPDSIAAQGDERDRG